MGPLLNAEHHTLARGGVAPLAAAASDGLACDHALHCLPVTGRVDVDIGVHHPVHGLAAGAHVWSRDVVFRSDVAAEGVGKAAGDALQVFAFEVAGVEFHPAFTSTIGQTGQSAFPCHPRRQCLTFIQVDILVVADASLVWSKDVIVLDPISFEHSHFA